MRQHHRTLAGLALAVLVAVACGPTTVSPTPSGSAPPPAGSPDASAPPSAGPGSSDGASEVGPIGNLVGTGWRVLQVDDLVPVAGSEPTVAFRADGQVVGTTGCNGYGGSFRIDGLQLEIGDLGQTLIGCSDAIGAMELAFTRAMREANELAAQGANLIIRGPGGEILLRPDATVGD